MCELFGLTSRLPTTVGLSMSVLARHGSRTRHLGDGWGVAFHDGDDALVIRQPSPLDESPWASFLGSQNIQSRIVLAHIRHATQGEISLRNTQPFTRELGGRIHAFAHNGRLTGIEQRFAGGQDRFRPIGTSDSEFAFCLLMDRLAPVWAGADVPSQAARESVVAELAAVLRSLGPANFLYTDGTLLFAHGHRRTQQEGTIAPPGLVMLTRTCATDPDALSAAGVDLPGDQAVTLFASVPLTGEPWRPLADGELVVAAAGSPLAK